MGITSGIVLYAVLWFLTFLIVIPIRLQTQGDVGQVVPGTHASSPEVHNLKKKALITTLAAAAGTRRVNRPITTIAIIGIL